MSTATIPKNIAAVPHTGAGDAGGVSRPNWYVAIVNNNSEKEVRERLARLGYDTYVAPYFCLPLCRDVCVVAETCETFTTNRAVATQRTPAIIPEYEMHTLQFILGNSDTPVRIEERPLHRGDRVKVVRGSLMGLEGEIIDTPSGSELVVRLDILGCARLNIERISVEPLPWLHANKIATQSVVI